MRGLRIANGVAERRGNRVMLLADAHARFPVEQPKSNSQPGQSPRDRRRGRHTGKRGVLAGLAPKRVEIRDFRARFRQIGLDERLIDVGADRNQTMTL